MRASQFFKCEVGWQGAGVPHFEAVLEKHDLHAGVAGVVTMHDGIDDGFGDDLLGDLVFGGNLCAVFPRAHPEVDFGEHEVFGLIDKIEDRAFVNLIRWDRLGDLVTVKVGALDFGGR